MPGPFGPPFGYRPEISLTSRHNAPKIVLNLTLNKAGFLLCQSVLPTISARSPISRGIHGKFDHIHETGRPLVLTVNGRADSVLIDAKVYEAQLLDSSLFQ